MRPVWQSSRPTGARRSGMHRTQPPPSGVLEAQMRQASKMTVASHSACVCSYDTQKLKLVAVNQEAQDSLMLPGVLALRHCRRPSFELRLCGLGTRVAVVLQHTQGLLRSSTQVT
jgi:hypothetical protein